MSQQSGIFISNESSFSDVPRPSGRNLSYFLNINDGNSLYAMRSNGSVFPITTADTMKVHKLSLNPAQINAALKFVSFAPPVPGVPVLVLPKAPDGFINHVISVSEALKFNTTPYAIDQAEYYMLGNKISFSDGDPYNPGSQIIQATSDHTGSCSTYPVGLTGVPLGTGYPQPVTCPEDLYVIFNNGNVPVNGDSDLDIYVSYKQVKLS